MRAARYLLLSAFAIGAPATAAPTETDRLAKRAATITIVRYASNWMGWSLVAQAVLVFVR